MRNKKFKIEKKPFTNLNCISGKNLSNKNNKRIKEKISNKRFEIKKYHSSILTTLRTKLLVIIIVKTIVI